MRLMTQQQPKNRIQNPLGPWKKQEADVEISLLANSIYYFLQCVFIVKDGEAFRLVVIYNNRVLTDLRYITLRGARIGFTKLHGDKAWEEDVRADWTHFYPPDEEWLEEKLKASVCA